jgi:hypothetical protein
VSLWPPHTHDTDRMELNTRIDWTVTAVGSGTEVIAPHRRNDDVNIVVPCERGVHRLIGVNNARVGDNNNSGSHGSMVADSCSRTRPATIKG